MAGNMNGANNAANNVYNGMNGLPSAGHFADMQTLRQNMETLAGWLAQNREEWAGLQEGLARIERMQNASQSNSERIVNGDAQPSDQPPPEDDDRPTITTLSAQLTAANSRIALLESQGREHETLQSLYESTLSDATERIRQYCFEQQNHIIALHQHYTEQLRQSREETIEAQVTHQRWQQGLQKLSEGVREAYKARGEERRPWVGKLRGLKEENRILRKMVGWEEPPPDSDDEEDGEGMGGVLQGPERGRVSQQGGGGGGEGAGGG